MAIFNSYVKLPEGSVRGAQRACGAFFSGLVNVTERPIWQGHHRAMSGRQRHHLSGRLLVQLDVGSLSWQKKRVLTYKIDVEYTYVYIYIDI